MTAMTLQARPVGVEKAASVAAKFAAKKGKKISPASVEQASKGFGTAGAKAADYYVFNMSEDDGFVIVSNDSRTEEILGYADNGSIDTANMPDGLKFMLSKFSSYVKYLNDISLTDVESEGEEEDKPVVTDLPGIAPLVSTLWGQGKPYNLRCPVIGGQNAVTGCTSTAAAMIMRYNKFPETYTWDAMLDDYSDRGYKDASYTLDVASDDVKELAEVMYFIGHNAKAEYGVNETATVTVNMIDVLRSIGYKSAKYIAYNRTNVDSLIYYELSHNRPVIISGQQSDGAVVGHDFICDGYGSNGFYHINWGWEGYCNGYYRLGALVPASFMEGDEMYPIGHDYSRSLYISAGLAPGEVKLPDFSYGSYYDSDNLVSVELKEFSYNIATINSTMEVKVILKNEGPAYRGNVTLNVYDPEGKTSKLVLGVDLKHGESIAYTFGLKAEQIGAYTFKANLKNKETAVQTMTVVDQLVVELEEPGTLLQKLGDQINSCNSLKVIGPVNGDDFAVIRAMLRIGDGHIYEPQHLDMEDAQIVDGGYNYNIVTKADCLPDEVFQLAFNLYTFIAPKTLCEIGGYAFSNCQTLDNLKLPETLKRIGALAFLANYELKEIILPDSVEFIDQQTFYYCTSLKKLHLSKNLKSVSYALFNGTPALEEVELPAVVPPTYQWSSQSTLKDGAGDFTIYVPYQSIKAYRSHPAWGLFNIAGRSYNQKGDVDGDGELTLADANLIVEYFLGNIDDECYDVEAADVNGDGEITVSDANEIVKKLQEEGE